MATKTSRKSTNKVVEVKKEAVVKETKEAAPKKAAVKKTTAVKKKTKPAVKKEAAVKEEKKAAPKKTTAKKTTTVKETKPAAKKEVTVKEEKVETKKEAVVKEVKKAVPKKTTTKKTTTVKGTKSAAKKETAVKEAKKATPKKAASKKATATSKKTTTTKKTMKKMTKEEQYNNLSLDTCLDLAKAMGMQVDKDSIIQQLILNPDVQSVSNDLVNKYQLTGKYTFEEDGYDEDLVKVLVSKVYESADIKPEKAEDLQADVNQALNYKYTDIIADGEEYKAQFDTMRKVLMIAQHKDIHDSKVLDDQIGVDTEKFVVEFMDLAYSVLKTWKYEDVDYYEHFIYAVLSQLENLHDTYRNRIMMDVADLYILHGDYGLGDADYGYILRENQIKDYIYYRYASIYEDIDKDKAKQIANQALQYVDGRYTYYPNIIAILED